MLLRKVAIGTVLLVLPPLTLAQAVNDTGEYWLKVAIVAFTWTLGVGVGSVLARDLGRADERNTQEEEQTQR